MFLTYFYFIEVIFIFVILVLLLVLLLQICYSLVNIINFLQHMYVQRSLISLM